MKHTIGTLKLFAAFVALVAIAVLLSMFLEHLGLPFVWRMILPLLAYAVVALSWSVIRDLRDRSRS